MNNAHNLNLLLRNQPIDVVRDALLEVLRNILLSADTLEAADHEPAQRTILVTRLENSPWLTLFDDGTIDDIDTLATDISARIGSPILRLLVHDGQTLNLSLYRSGQCIDELSQSLFDEEQTIPQPTDISHWQTLLPPGTDPSSITAALNRSDRHAPLDHLADLLQLRTQRQTEIEDLNENEHPNLLRLRLISARKRRGTRSAAKPNKIPRPSIPPSPEPPPSAKAIPELLIGKPAEVKRRLRPIIKKVIATNDWSVALAGVNHIPIDDISLSVMTSPPNQYDFGDPFKCDRVLLYIVNELLYDFDISNQQRRDLILQGMDRPWFCLAAVTCTALSNHGLEPAEKHALALTALQKMLRWWRDLCRWGPMLDDALRRDVKDWEPWRIPVLRWCENLGHNWEREVNPLRDGDSEDALDRILTWVTQAQRATKQP